ncbi:MAG: hypothetical protein JXR96_01040 [Deltaproteobacteria bacterium]|nr:hypothetical protein [Deltaproteobacteria bacterium]
MRSRDLLRIGLLAAVCLAGAAWVGCGSSGEDGCERDGDCPVNWRCDPYSRTCRCVSDAACNEDVGEKCMPDGTCQIYTGCTTDQECGALHRCDTATGECLCTDDAACAEGEKCNASGFCQPATGCYDNEDCGAGEYCDVTTRRCIASNTCTNKYQCPIEHICSGGTCVPGCEDHGDCELRTACVNGTCQEGVCGDDSFCGFMEYCYQGQCRSAYDDQYAPYCKPCDTETGGVCGVSRQNPCVIYPYTDDAYGSRYDEYCGVDCSAGQSCPNGFSCNTLRLVDGRDAPTGDACCDENDDPACCANNNCPAGIKCCARHIPCPGGLPCAKSAEEDKGYCPCTLDSRNPCDIDNTCLKDTCLGGTCWAMSIAGIRVPCSGDQDCQLCTATLSEPCNTDADCREIVCELWEGVDYGGCSAGAACGLKEGYHCPLP